MQIIIVEMSSQYQVLRHANSQIVIYQHWSEFFQKKVFKELSRLLSSSAFAFVE